MSSASDSASGAASGPLTITFRLTPALLPPQATLSSLALTIAHPHSTSLRDLKALLASEILRSATSASSPASSSATAATAPTTPLDPDSLRLVYAGRIFKDDDATLAELGIKEGAVVHATKLASNRAAEESAAASAGESPARRTAGSPASAAPTTLRGAAAAAQRNAFGMPDMGDMLENPVVRSMLENPDFMRTLLENDPRIARLAESNPSLRQTLSDPRFLREMLDTMRNPALSQEMMRNVDRQLLNIENIPGGFNALSSMYHDFQAPLSQAHEEDPSTDEANRRFAERFGAQRRTSDEGINNDALPNPWAPPPPPQPSATAQRQQGGAAHLFGGAMGGGGGGWPFMGGAAGGGWPFMAGAGGGGAAQNPFAAMMMPPTATNPANQPNQQQQQQQQQQPFDLNALLSQIQSMQSLFQPATGTYAAPNLTTASTASPQSPSATTTATATAATTPAPIVDTARHEERFATQLAALADMGFDEKDRCIRALLAAGGNVEAAIAYMLDSP
ncbi:Ubiquilin-1 [Geranomyces variabilis]|uniref:Ubiquilin-1 n=1 Tax=Geranomyces variabilis TaxID=109894 RepID=A0AAD5TDA2_9FUNG|nr:Ubiquilin-1 [Geranomyces variabilis]